MELYLINVINDWTIYCNSTEKRGRWLIDERTRLPSLQKKKKTKTSRDATPLLSNGKWTFLHYVNGLFVDVPILFLPERCPQVIHEWLQRPEPRGPPAAFAVTFCSRFEGARRDDVAWIIGQLQLHHRTWERCNAIDIWQSNLLKHHPRRDHLLQTFSRKNNQRSGIFADTVKDCLEADPPVCHGPKKTYHYVDNSTLIAELSIAQRTQNYLLCDPVWFNSLPSETSDHFIANLPNDSKRLLDVQDLGVPEMKDGFRQIPAKFSILYSSGRLAFLFAMTSY